MLTRLLLFVLALGLAACTDYGRGIEIYLINDMESADDAESHPGCMNCLKVKPHFLLEPPLFTEEDFEEVHVQNQIITLSPKANERLEGVQIPISGLPAVLCIDKKPVYSFWFWNPLSSQGCDRVYAYATNPIEFKFGLPLGSAYGPDPRNTELFQEYYTR